jgi:riboflavin biosynthesis pyrimidine reductase
MEVVWYTAMSMDGRIASADGSLDFLDISLSEGSGHDFGQFIAGVDGVLVGASTLRWLISHGHGWPHDDLPTWLASHDADLAESVKPTRAAFRRVEGDLTPALDEMERNAHRRIWLAGGGAVAAQVLDLDRLTEVIATVAPTALGLGPALFDAPALPLRRFELVECRPSGAAAMLHWVRREQAT